MSGSFLRNEMSDRRFAREETAPHLSEAGRVNGQLMDAEGILFAERKWPCLVVRGLYRYEHAGFGGVFEPGFPVTLVRDPCNAFDSNVVKVILQDGKMLGYIAKETAALISDDLKRGAQFVALVADSEFLESKWGQCELEIAFKIAAGDFEKLEALPLLDSNEVSRHYSDVDPYSEPGVWVSRSKSALAEAVAKNDVVSARRLIAKGCDVNEMTFVFARSDGVHAYRMGFYTSPVLMQVRSVEMYKIFESANAVLYPRSFIRKYGPSWTVYGREHNLLEDLWRGPRMDADAVELADYLVFTEYDKPLGDKIDEIKNVCEQADGCPYEQNKEYVLEWCDMERRAKDAAVETMKMEYMGPESLGDDLMKFISTWQNEGYEKAVQETYSYMELSPDEVPPRYVYPERITKRGFQHSVTTAVVSGGRNG